MTARIPAFLQVSHREIYPQVREERDAPGHLIETQVLSEHFNFYPPHFHSLRDGRKAKSHWKRRLITIFLVLLSIVESIKNDLSKIVGSSRNVNDDLPNESIFSLLASLVEIATTESCQGKWKQ
jgi:hypothetical protein